MRNFLIIGAIAASALLLSCKNPFKNEVSGNQRTLKGTLTIEGEEKPDGVFVFLEGLEVGVSTDEKGAFSLTLPRDISASSGGGVDGVYDLYFYLANYQAQTAPVVIRNGAFVLGEGRWNKDGTLRDRPHLIINLDVTTDLVPGYKGIATSIVAKTVLKAIRGDASAILPNASQEFLGGIFIHNLDNNSVTRLLVPSGGNGKLYQAEISSSGRTFVAIFDVKDLGLPPGRYRIVPHVLPNYEGLAVQIAASLGFDPTQFTDDFLQFPFKFSGGFLQVKEEPPVAPN